MSEYQRYEFQAIDRPLTAKEQAALRNYSSRATITSRRFAVGYSWGDFKGNPAAWMEKYFDAFLYLANWGTHELMLRLPRSVLPFETAKAYCAGERASVRAGRDHIVLGFRSEEEEGSEWIDEDNDTLASLVPVRAELAGGDWRALYIAWLGCAQAGELDDEDLEPRCPPGLGTLSPALEAFATFLRIDEDLLEAAATGSAALGGTDDGALEAWVAALPEAEKSALLVRLIGGTEAHLRGELARRFRESGAGRTPAATPKARTVAELLGAAAARAEERRRQQAERAEREKARREQDAAEIRERHLLALAKREAQAWREVDTLIATKQPKHYDAAVALLHDLRDVCLRSGRLDEAAKRIARLREEHAKKPSLIDRFRKAALL